MFKLFHNPPQAVMSRMEAEVPLSYRMKLQTCGSFIARAWQICFLIFIAAQIVNYSHQIPSSIIPLSLSKVAQSRLKLSWTFCRGKLLVCPRLRDARRRHVGSSPPLHLARSPSSVFPHRAAPLKHSALTISLCYQYLCLGQSWKECISCREIITVERKYLFHVGAVSARETNDGCNFM